MFFYNKVVIFMTFRHVQKKIFQCFIFPIYFSIHPDNQTDLMEAVTCKFSTLFWCSWLWRRSKTRLGRSKLDSQAPSHSTLEGFQSIAPHKKPMDSSEHEGTNTKQGKRRKLIVQLKYIATQYFIKKYLITVRGINPYSYYNSHILQWPLNLVSL